MRVAKFVNKRKFVGTANASAGSMRAPSVETSRIVHGSAHCHESGMQVDFRLYLRWCFMRSIAIPAAGRIGKRHQPLPRGTVEIAAPGSKIGSSASVVSYWLTRVDYSPCLLAQNRRRVTEDSGPERWEKYGMNINL